MTSASPAPPTIPTITNLPRSEQAARLLTARITSGELPSGAFLPTEAELCRELGVSRATIREAVRKLEARGLVVSRHGVGVQVADGTEQAVADAINLLLVRRGVGPRDVFEVRLTLECQAASLAAARATPEAIAAIAASIEAMRDESLPQAQQVDYDLEFHLRVAEASQNVVLVALIHTLRGVLRDYILATFQEEAAIGPRIAIHEAILARIAAHDPEGAGEVMRAHLLPTEAVIHRLAPDQAATLLRKEAPSSPPATAAVLG